MKTETGNNSLKTNTLLVTSHIETILGDTVSVLRLFYSAVSAREREIFFVAASLSFSVLVLLCVFGFFFKKTNKQMRKIRKFGKKIHVESVAAVKKNLPFFSDF